MPELYNKAVIGFWMDLVDIEGIFGVAMRDGKY